jgi:hypothetical protein
MARTGAGSPSKRSPARFSDPRGFGLRTLRGFNSASPGKGDGTNPAAIPPTRQRPVAPAHTARRGALVCPDVREASAAAVMNRVPITARRSTRRRLLLGGPPAPRRVGIWRNGRSKVRRAWGQRPAERSGRRGESIVQLRRLRRRNRREMPQPVTDRRHLTGSQRAMVAAKLANLRNGTNRHEQKVGPPIGGPTHMARPHARTAACECVQGSRKRRRGVVK